MVKGLDKFREAFKGFSDNYVIIGGTACDIVLSGTDMRPRATNDIDMILVVENMTVVFAKAFWDFIKEGGYKKGQRKREDELIYELYRFEDGKEGYPTKIELLSHHSDLFGEPSGFHIEPIPVDEDISSLSAIIMDDEYYDFTIHNTLVDNGLRYASPIALIVLKAKAYVNLLDARKAGHSVNSKDIKKHRNDVLKLVATMVFNRPIPVALSIYNNIRDYINQVELTLNDNPKSLEDALQRDVEDIRAYLGLLKDYFVAE